ncbi:MAG TPA: MFS transporter [Blattabacteriaceae bacterium]|nr:MFS transporter [Blattabacteriaceae bacterium]
MGISSTDVELNGGTAQQSHFNPAKLADEMNNGGKSTIEESTIEQAAPVELKPLELTTIQLKPVELTIRQLTTDAPTLPSADALDGLALATVTDAAVTDAAETTVIEIPRIARALRHRDFRLFWTGNFLSNIGTWMQNIAQGWLVLQLTNSAFWLGVVGFAASFPILLFALIGGVIADHVNKRKMLMVTQSAMMTFAFIMAALAYFKIINVNEIIFLALGTGIAMSLNTPTYQALVPQLVPREDLTNAIALNSAQFNMSRVLGPTLGGFAMAIFGVAGNFFLNGLSFLAVLIALTRIRYIEPVLPQADHFVPPQADHSKVPGEGHLSPPRAGRLWEKLKQGFIYAFSHSSMSSLILLVAIGSLLAIPYLTFVPYFARDVLGSGARGLGILMACSGAGAFLGAITIASLMHLRRRGLFVVRASAGFYAAIIAFTFSRNFYLSGLLLAVAGYCMIISVATINSLLQHLAEDHMRGRVMSIYSTAFLGLPPIGCLIAGSLSHLFYAPHVIAGMCSLAIGGSLAVYVNKEGLRDLD